MAEEFKILLGVELEAGASDAINGQLSNMKVDPIDLKINSKTVQPQLSNIAKQIQQSGNSAGNGFAKAFNTSLARMSMTSGVATNTIKNMRNALANMKFDDASIDLVTKDLESMNIAISNITTKMNGNYLNLSIKGIDELGRAITVVKQFDNQFGKILSSGQTISQSFDTGAEAAKRFKDIMDSFSNGSITNGFDKIKTSFSNIKNQSTETKTAFEDFNVAFKNLDAAIQSNDMDAVIKSYDEYEKALKKVKNQIDINARAEKQSLDVSKLKTAKKSLSSSMDIWLKNNSAATKQFGARLEELKVRLQTCDAVELNNIQAEFREIQKEAKLAGVATQSFSDKLKKKFSDVGSYLSAATIIAQSVQAIRSMYDNVVEVDTAMTGLYRVTDLTSQQYSVLYDQMISSAKEYGATLDNIINATTDWVRAGFDADTSLGLAEITTMYQHISDLDYDVAAENLITAYKGFQDELLSLYDGDEVAAVQYIADIFNELDNNFAVTSAGLGEALTRSASALDAAGNTIQESAAMITGITEVTQDPEKAGSALKILSLRLRGMKGQLQELGEEVDENVESVSKMQTQILNFTGGKVNIFNDDGSFKSTYEIMDGIAEIYNELSNTDPTAAADLLETIAGKNRANDIMALISNWGNVEEAMKSAMGAEGSAAAENAKHMDSIQGRLDALTASWQAFSNTVVDSDFVKTIISGLTEVIDCLDFVIDKVGILNTAFAGIAIGKVVKQISSVAKAAGGLSAIGDAASLLSLAFPNAAKGISIFTSALSNSTSVIGVLKAAISGLWTVLSAHPIAAVISAIALAVAAFNHFHTSAKEANEKMADAFDAYDDAKQKVINVKDELDNVKSRMDELQAKGGLTFVEQQELEDLRETTKLLQIQADLAEKEEKRKAKEAAESASEAYKNNFEYEISKEKTDEYIQDAELTKNNAALFTDKKNISAMIAGIRQMEKLRDETQKLRDETELGSDEWNWYNEDLEHFNEVIDSATDSVWEQTSVLTDYKEKLESIPTEELTEGQKNALQAISDSIAYIYQEFDPVKWKQMQFDQIFNEKLFSDAKKELVKIAAANKSVGITVDDIINKYPELAQAVKDAGFTVEDLVNNINSEAGAVNVDEVVKQAKEQLAESMSDSTETIETDATVSVGVEAEVKEASLSEVNEWLDSLTDEDKIIACDIIFNNDTSGWALETFENKLAEAKKSIEQTVEPIKFSDLIANEDFNQTVDGYVEKVEKLKDALKSLQSGEFAESDFIELSKIFPELADNADNLDVAILELLDTMNTDMVSYFNDQFGNLETEEDVAALENFMNAVLKLGEVVGNTQFGIDINTETESMNNLFAAQKESISSTGLSSESIKALKARYKDLDYSELFENTSNGIRLNTDALNDLEDAYEQQTKNKLDNKLQELQDQYYDLTNQINDCNDAVQQAELYAQRDDIVNQINDVATLRSQFEGLTSAYNKWQQAQSNGNARDMYSGIISGKEELEEEMARGWLDEDSIAYLELLTGKDLSNSAVGIKEQIEAYKELNNVINSAGYTVWDFFTYDKNGKETSEGIFNFFDTVMAKQKELQETTGKSGKSLWEELGYTDDWVSIDKDGNYSFDFTTSGGDDVIAEALGISAELVQIILRAAENAGFKVKIDESSYTELEQFKTKVEETKEAYVEALGKDGATRMQLFDVNVEDAGIEDEIDKVKNRIKELEGMSPVTAEIEAETAYAQAALDYLIQRQIELEQPTFMQIEVSEVNDTGLQEALTLIQNYQTAVNELKTLELKGADTSEIETATTKVNEYATAVQALPDDVKTKLGISTEDVDLETIKAQIAGIEAEVFVKPVLENSSDITGVTDETTSTITIEAQLGDSFDTVGNMVRGINEHVSTITIDAQIGEGFDRIGQMVSGINQQVSTITIDAQLGESFDTVGQSIANIDQTVKTITIDAKTGTGFDTIGQKISGINQTTATVSINAKLGDSFNDVGTAISGISETEETISVDIEVDDKEIQNFEPSDKDAEVKYSVNDEEVEGYEAPDKEAEVEYSVEDGEVQAYRPPNKEAVVTYSPDFGAIYGAEPPTLHGKVVYKAEGAVKSEVDGTAHAHGTAFAQGTTGKAYKQGDWGTKDSGIALGGELGQELVVRDGRFFTIGDNSAEFFKYQKGDIIFNAEQTKQIFEKGKITTGTRRGKAYADGTTFAEGNAFSTGSGGTRITISGSVIKSSSTKNKSEAAKKSKKSSKEKDDFEETFDWIEVAIDRIERAIDELDLKASSVYRSWSVRNQALKDEMAEITGEIDIQQKGYKRYMKEANKVGLSESWAKLVRNGAIDIDTVQDEELAEKIKEYQEW